MIRPQACISALNLNNHNIDYCNEIKFLGLVWDRKLTWKPHIIKLKEKYSRTLNILKSITAQKWGVDQLMTMRVFRSITRSVLDYGAIVYNSASDSTLKPLEVITTEALRITSGAFKSTPTTECKNNRRIKTSKNLIKPEFSYQLLNITCPTWSLLGPDINVDLCEFPKNQTPRCI